MPRRTWKDWTPEERAREVERVAIWRKTPQGLASTARYEKSDKHAAAAARYDSTELGHATRRRAKRAWKQRNPELVRLQKRGSDAVYSALTAGRLVRLPCGACGDPRTQAHHPNGYEGEHALDVVWLCVGHHRVTHGRPVRDRRYDPVDVEKFLARKTWR